MKKIGRIPAGGGWRVHGKGTDAHRASQRQPRPGYAYLHSVVDDCSRLAYTEELPDEKRLSMIRAAGTLNIDDVSTDVVPPPDSTVVVATQ